MKFIKKLTKLMMFLLLICMLFTGCKNRKESEIPTESNHIENTEEIESSSTIPDEEPAKEEEADSTPKVNESETQIKLEDDNSIKKIYKEDLSTEGEKVVFGFRVADSKKSVSICMADDESYIVYRFGTMDNIELEFPEDRENSFIYFTYSYYLRGGGVENAGLDLNSFKFSNGGYQYQVYNDYDAEAGIKAVGIRVTEEKTGKETDIAGDSNTVIGSMLPFRDMEKIVVE
ncbi:hypothetical protein [Anaerocolumna sp.]|uniref:hypothetical protein n=1 Tax=Anaerocolumna sp. TaxID=2041569 RepID=UPI0028A7752A|nr:hypothetical protein [Anaerocolumna sp.]